VYSLKEYDKCENASEAVLPGPALWAGKEMMLFWWILWEEAYWNVQKPQQDIWG